MKAIKLDLVILGILLITQSSVYSQSFEKMQDSPSNASNSLEINCKMQKDESKTSSSFTISLIHQNTEIESVIVEAGKSFKFLLKENTWYALKIKNEESISKIISINTWIPFKNRYSLCHYNLFFEIGAPMNYTESKNFDSDLMDFPVAIIFYDVKKEAFYLNEKYFYNIRMALIASMN